MSGAVTPEEAQDGLRAWELETAELLRGAVSEEQLSESESEVFGRRSQLAELQRGLGARPAEERPAWGRLLQSVRGRLEEVARGRRSELASRERAARIEAERLDLTEVLPTGLPGHLHVVTQTRDALEDVFVGMGYQIAEGPEVETDWYNFEALNMPPAHPARAAQDSFYLERGRPESIVLRTHTSPMQIRLLEAQPPPIYAVVPGRAYRRDTPDASHLPTFHQIEGLAVDHGITFGDLAGTLEQFTRAFFGDDIRTRLRPAFFPFTEPSAEYDITCTVCRGSGCRTCSGVGWLELGGCGLVDPAVFENVGVDPEEWSGFAFGFGIDRCAQMRWQIADMRIMIDNDVRFLSEL